MSQKKTVPGTRTAAGRKRVRAIARERIGTVKPAQTIEPKKDRKPKHKRPPGTEEAS